MIVTAANTIINNLRVIFAQEYVRAIQLLLRIWNMYIKYIIIQIEKLEKCVSSTSIHVSNVEYQI